MDVIGFDISYDHVTYRIINCVATHFVFFFRVKTLFIVYLGMRDMPKRRQIIRFGPRRTPKLAKQKPPDFVVDHALAVIGGDYYY